MINNYLLQSQKNEILIIIKKKGFNPGLFEWSKIRSTHMPDSLVSRLNYLYSDFFFTFDMNGETHYAVFSPADNSYIGSAYPAAWESQKKCFVNWLKNLNKELSEPDLWGNFPTVKRSGENLTHEKKTYSADPSADSPGQHEMSKKIDRLFENRHALNKDSQKTTGFVIKRYYGKA